MAIQQINLGSAPSGAGGDTQRAANTKINQNFSNQAHAASQLMVSAGGKVPEWHINDGIQLTGWGGRSGTEDSESTTPIHGQIRKMNSSNLNIPVSGTWAGVASMMTARGYGVVLGWGQLEPNDFYISGLKDHALQPWRKVYHSANTNKGTNGVLSGKSPVTHLYHDRVEHTGNEKELEPIEFIKQGVGNYLLKNTTGLAQEGWYIVIPHDANGNPLIAVEYEDNDGDVSVRTYKRKFDYEQAKVVADKDNPMDIPETRWIDLRFNDDPSLYKDEVLDEPIE